MTSERPVVVAAFASGGGTNLQSLLDRQAETDCGWRVGVVIANRAAVALDRARAAGVDTALIPTKDRDPSAVARDTRAVLDAHGVQVIALAGYLRLLPVEIVRAYAGRIVNIHPALLPSHGGPGMYGMNVHRAVLEAGDTVTGATIHLVTERYDEGAVLAQWEVPVRATDDAEDIAARVLGAEHRLYPRVLDHVCAAIAGREPVTPLGTLHRVTTPSTEEVR